MKRWQFSLRGLLFLMAAVSLVLAFAVSLPDIFKLILIIAAAVLFVIGLFQSANFATSERRPRLAALSWTVLGAFFALFALLCVRGLMAHEAVDFVALVMACTMSACCAVCVFSAYRSFRQIGSNEAGTTTAELPTGNGSCN